MELKKILIDTIVHPKKEVVATCSVCRVELKREEWDTLGCHQRKKKEMEKTIAKCPFCGAVFKETKSLIWEKKTVLRGRRKEVDYIAKAKNGDFLIWKWGGGYGYRYRKYGVENPDGIFWKRTKDEAMKACQQHPEWKI